MTRKIGLASLVLVVAVVVAYHLRGCLPAPKVISTGGSTQARGTYVVGVGHQPGNMFAGLLANLLNGGEVVDEASLKSVLPRLKQFFDKLGYLQESSSDLFTQFLQQGVGSYPLIVGYEAQLVEFGIENAQYREM